MHLIRKVVQVLVRLQSSKKMVSSLPESNFHVFATSEDLLKLANDKSYKITDNDVVLIIKDKKYNGKIIEYGFGGEGKMKDYALG